MAEGGCKTKPGGAVWESGGVDRTKPIWGEGIWGEGLSEGAAGVG